MKRQMSIIVLLLGVLTISACLKETNDVIVGKWYGSPVLESEENGYSLWNLEFKSDGTYTSTLSCTDCAEYVTTGQYSYTQKVEELILNGSEESKMHVLRFTVNGNNAVLEEAGNKQWVFNRR